MVALKKDFSLSDFNRKEILRYAQCSGNDDSVEKILDECIDECKDIFSYGVCYCEFPVNISDKEIAFPFATYCSNSLMKNLEECNRIVLFAATIGIAIDRLIAKYSRISPTKAVMFQAIGTERIEALCDAFCDDLKDFYKENDLYTRPRFSPGYGDFSIEAQRDIFRVLDCHRKIGLSLNESLLMSPSKSVTAIVGISDKNRDCKVSCSECSKSDCSYRRNG